MSVPRFWRKIPQRYNLDRDAVHLVRAHVLPAAFVLPGLPALGRDRSRTGSRGGARW